MGSLYFGDCNTLIAAVFLVNASGVSEISNVFAQAASGFVVYFLSSNTGFTTPAWVPINPVEDLKATPPSHSTVFPPSPRFGFLGTVFR